VAVKKIKGAKNFLYVNIRRSGCRCIWKTWAFMCSSLCHSWRHCIVVFIIYIYNTHTFALSFELPRFVLVVLLPIWPTDLFFTFGTNVFLRYKTTLFQLQRLGLKTSNKTKIRWLCE
jgi:hypothetical protein